MALGWRRKWRLASSSEWWRLVPLARTGSRPVSSSMSADLGVPPEADQLEPVRPEPARTVGGARVTCASSEATVRPSPWRTRCRRGRDGALGARLGLGPSTSPISIRMPRQSARRCTHIQVRALVSVRVTSHDSVSPNAHGQVARSAPRPRRRNAGRAAPGGPHPIGDVLEEVLPSWRIALGDRRNDPSDERLR